MSVFPWPLTEKLAEEPVVIKAPKPTAVNKWEGEDEDEVKVSIICLDSMEKM